MLKVDTHYENTNEGKVHFKGSENEFLHPQIGSGDRLVVTETLGDGSSNIYGKMLRNAGIQRDSLTIINTISCKLPNNVYPGSEKCDYISKADAKQAQDQCWKNYVQPLLQSRDWDRIDALGDQSLRRLTGKTDGIAKWRGSPLPLIGEQKTNVIGTWHPGYLMRDQRSMPDMVSDLKKGTVPPPENYNLRPTVQDLIDFRSETVCFDIETNRFTNEITMIGLQSEAYKVVVSPFKGPYLDEIKRIFRNAKHVIGHNIVGFDLPRMGVAGVALDPEAQVWDTMLMQHLLHPDSAHDLEYVVSIYTNKPAWKHLASDNMPLYCARDVDGTYQAFTQLKHYLEQQKLTNLYKHCQIPLQKIVSSIQDVGLTVDGNRINVVRIETLKQIEELEQTLPPELKPYDKSIRIRQPAPEGTLGKSGKPVKYIHIPATERIQPWNSDAKLKKYLYETKGYPVQKNSKSNAISTDKKALARLYKRTKDPDIKTLQKLAKLSTLVSGFLKESKLARGKVHPHLSVVGTSTGRLSCAAPNLQQQPPEAKFAYVPSDPEWCFVEADYASGENRLTALYANDTDRLRRLATPGYNEHKLNASIFFEVPIEEIDKDDPEGPYKKGKSITHGINFGEGARKIAQDNDFDEKEIRKAIDNWRRANPCTVSWQQRTSSSAEREGVLTNAFDRKRWFWTTSTYTESLAFLPQSTLADMIYRAMIGLYYERINWPVELALKASPVLAPLPLPARLVLQVHDSLLVETPVALVPQVIDCLEKCMAQPWTQLGGYSIPAEFKVGGAGHSWGELKPYHA